MATWVPSCCSERKIKARQRLKTIPPELARRLR
ncbi:protein of unknown function [Azospirillum lipoferum 4B]|uniref:Uncharacterized protein n=1 Tax=Azospirillum lipoferum (strain 4B) TaxID=862719 RepID=G7Z860_AZOL4|nr:protein of unknown function [Azospirillum lipoferum 4B]